MRASLALCYANHSFLYQARPDLIPYGFLSETEMYLWAEYLDSIKPRQ